MAGGTHLATDAVPRADALARAELERTRATAPAGEAAPDPAAGKKKRAKRGAKRAGPSAADAEFGVSRGVDFCDVTAVINLDLPTSVEVYRHRIGRTARGGKGGTAISLVCADDKLEEDMLAEVHEAYEPGVLQQFHVDMSKLAAFRYRGNTLPATPWSPTQHA